jgi:hypothetical protein
MPVATLVDGFTYVMPTQAYYTVTLVPPVGTCFGQSYVNVYLGGTKTQATIYSDNLLTSEITQPFALPEDNVISFYVADNALTYDVQVFGGNLCRPAWIYDVGSISSTIWELDQQLWSEDPDLWSATNPVSLTDTGGGVGRIQNVGQLYTGFDLVKAAMRLIQVSATDTDLTAAELQDGIESLNRMLDQWGVEELMLYQVIRETFPITNNQNPFTIGYGADWNTIRPTKIVDAYLTIYTGALPVDYPMQIIGYDDYNAIRLKTLSTNFPSYLYYEPSFPIAKAYIYPVCAASNETITITSWKPLCLINDPTCYLELPPGYWEAIVFNLAVRIAEEYQFDIRPTTVALATNALRIIKRMNQRTPTLQTDNALMNTSQMRYNIYSDGYGR